MAPWVKMLVATSYELCPVLGTKVLKKQNQLLQVVFWSVHVLLDMAIPTHTRTYMHTKGMKNVSE